MNKKRYSFSFLNFVIFPFMSKLVQRILALLMYCSTVSKWVKFPFRWSSNKSPLYQCNSKQPVWVNPSTLLRFCYSVLVEFAPKPQKGWALGCSVVQLGSNVQWVQKLWEIPDCQRHSDTGGTTMGTLLGNLLPWANTCWAECWGGMVMAHVGHIWGARIIY